MVVLLDTTTIAPRNRNDAMMAIMDTAAVPFIVSHDLPDELIHNRTLQWNIGPSNAIVRTQDTNMRFHRTPQKLRADDREMFAMCFQHHGIGVHIADETVVTQKPGSLFLENVARVHTFEYDGKGDNGSFLMSYDDLAMPVDLVMDAATRLASSPLYRLLQVHLSRLSEVAESLPADGEASALLALTTIQLIRALLASTTLESRHARDAAEDARHATLMAYVRLHLRDPSLDARKIAAETHTSVRQVYKTWGGNGQTLSQWILHERLDGARRDLAAPESLLTTIEVVARRWGFVDPGHFSRRFRETYGFTPRDWRMHGIDNSTRAD
jgi:AraC-like DNA-binding protein